MEANLSICRWNARNIRDWAIALNDDSTWFKLAILCLRTFSVFLLSYSAFLSLSGRNNIFLFSAQLSLDHRAIMILMCVAVLFLSLIIWDYLARDQRFIKAAKQFTGPLPIPVLGNFYLYLNKQPEGEVVLATFKSIESENALKLGLNKTRQKICSLSRGNIFRRFIKLW